MLGKKPVSEKLEFSKKKNYINMEMFDVHRRDIFNFDDYMDLKKPGFGGPKSAKQYLDARGKKVNDSPKLKDYQHTVERHPAFKNQVYDPTYKAMTHDVVYKQEKKKSFDYPDSYNHMGLPVVMVGKAANEGFSYTSFTNFINEMDHYGANPAEETKVSLRGKSDLDAIGDAEDKLLDAKIDWEDFYFDRKTGRVDYTDADGDLIAYVDVAARKLYIMPDAAIMSDEKQAMLQGKEFEKESSEEEYEEDDDAYFKSDEEYYLDNEIEDDGEHEERIQLTRREEDAESLLRSFEEDED